LHHNLRTVVVALLWILARVDASRFSRAPPHLVTALAYLAAPCLRFVSLFSAATGFIDITKPLRDMIHSGGWVVGTMVVEAGDQLMLRSHITALCIWVLAIANALVVCVVAGCSSLTLTASLASHVVVPVLLDVRMRRQLRAPALRTPTRPACNA
jgi:hypothetical protein